MLLDYCWLKFNSIKPVQYLNDKILAVLISSMFYAKEKNLEQKYKDRKNFFKVKIRNLFLSQVIKLSAVLDNKFPNRFIKFPHSLKKNYLKLPNVLIL